MDTVLANMAITNVVGALLLLHAAYSSYEHHQVLKHATLVPQDIVLELVIALVLLNFGTLELLKNKLRRGVAHNGIVEPETAYLQPIHMGRAMAAVNRLGVTQYEELDTRPDFVDVRAKRKEYLEWAQAANREAASQEKAEAEAEKAKAEAEKVNQ